MGEDNEKARKKISELSCYINHHYEEGVIEMLNNNEMEMIHDVIMIIIMCKHFLLRG